MQTLFVILFAILSLVALIASLLLMQGLFPIRVERIRQTLENHWKRAFWIGLLNTVLISILVLGLGSLADSSPLFFIPAFGIYGAFLIGLLYGLTAFVDIIGERLFPEKSPVKRIIRSGTVFLLASLLPVIGWFLLFPYGISLAAGAVVITISQDRKRKKNNQDQQE
jgi:hypothetical protein